MEILDWRIVSVFISVKSVIVPTLFVIVFGLLVMRNGWKRWCWGRNSSLSWRRWRTLLLSWPKQLMVTFHTHPPKLLTIPTWICVFTQPSSHYSRFILRILCLNLFLFSPLRAVGLWWPPLGHSSGIKSRELHERCWYFSLRIMLLLLIVFNLMHLSCPFVPFTQHLWYWWMDHSTDLLFRVVTAPVPMPLASGWPLCSSWPTPRPTSLAWTSCTSLPRWGGALGWIDGWRTYLRNHENLKLCNWFILLLHLFYSLLLYTSFIFRPQQAEDIDGELLTFHTQLEHIGMGSRWLSWVHWQSVWWFTWACSFKCCHICFNLILYLVGMLHNFVLCQCVTVACQYRICKEEVITDFEREVKKVKEVKLYNSRQPGLLQQMETFFLVKFPLVVWPLYCAKAPTELGNTSVSLHSAFLCFKPFFMFSFLRGLRPSWQMWICLFRS